VWCASYKLKDSITSQAQLSWWGRHKTWMTSEKNISNDQWEALACLCKHPSVIKFLAIHIETMETYTLWWNGGTFREVLDYYTKYSPIINKIISYYSKGGLDMEG